MSITAEEARELATTCYEAELQKWKDAAMTAIKNTCLFGRLERELTVPCKHVHLIYAYLEDLGYKVGVIVQPGLLHISWAE